MPRGDRHRVVDPEPAGEGALEALQHRPEREPARAQDLEHQLLLARAEVGPGERDLLGCHRRTPGCASRRACGWNAYSSESTSASHEASMMFSETPIVPHDSRCRRRSRAAPA